MKCVNFLHQKIYKKLRPILVEAYTKNSLHNENGQKKFNQSNCKIFKLFSTFID